jgi:hypothetical protein
MHPLLEAHRTRIAAVAARHGVRALFVFGSMARGDAGAESDVDFLVDLEPGRSLFDLGRMATELEDLLGRPVDVVTRAGLRERLRDRVLREATPL